jgi:hypothetical protein
MEIVTVDTLREWIPGKYRPLSQLDEVRLR